jgi:hypothetical protein
MVVFYSGYTIQVDREDFPHSGRCEDLERGGCGKASASTACLRLAGAGAEPVAVDVPWRNPFERRFRVFSYGLAPANSLALVSEPFDWTTDDRETLRGLGRQMVAFLGAAPGSDEKFFGKSVQNSFGRLQYLACPTITSSLTGDVIPSRDLVVQLGNDIARERIDPVGVGGP